MYKLTLEVYTMEDDENIDRGKSLLLDVEWPVLPRVDETVDFGVDSAEVTGITHNILGGGSIPGMILVSLAVPRHIYDMVQSKENWRRED